MDNPVDQHTARPCMRRGIAQRLFLFILTPIILITGLLMVNTVGKHEIKAFATYQGAAADAVKLCVVEDFQKYALVIMGALGGSFICLLVRAEYDVEFAKRSYGRRIVYCTVALVFSAQFTPYILMKMSEDQGKSLCLLMGSIDAIMAWGVLEVIYNRAKAISSWLVDRLPLPRVSDAPDKKPPTA